MSKNSITKVIFLKILDDFWTAVGSMDCNQLYCRQKIWKYCLQTLVFPILWLVFNSSVTYGVYFIPPPPGEIFFVFKYKIDNRLNPDKIGKNHNFDFWNRSQGIVDYTRLGIALANLIILGSSSSFLLLFNVNERPSSLLPQSLPDLEIITEWLLDQTTGY